jgi:LysM repeat protein
MVVPAATPRPARSPLTPRQSGLTRTHQLMIASFAIICIGMVLGMVLVRVWDEASRAVAALPPEGSASSSHAAGSLPAPAAPAPPVPPVDESVPPGAGAVTTEIRVLQPNYTVAPGDTLGIIARRHGTSVEALASINNLENRNSLGVGQKLIIP